MVIKQPFNYSPKNQNRTLHIYLPNDYDASAERYPVMYFFDGHNLFRDSDATYGKCWGLEAFLDGWQKSAAMRAGSAWMNTAPTMFGAAVWEKFTAWGERPWSGLSTR